MLQTEIKAIRGIYDLSEEMLEKHSDIILRYEREIKTCQNCNGECKQPIRGFMPVLQMVDGAVYDAVKICNFEEQKRKQAKINRLFKSAKVPKRYENLTFADYDVTPDNQQAVKAAKWAINDTEGQGLYIYGHRGTGKTMLSAIVANERIKQGKPVLFSSVPDLLADIRASFKNNNTDEVLLSVKTADFLILDDLGAEKMTEWVAEQLFSIINYRYNEKLPMIITSNYDPKQIIGRMTIVDRYGNIIDSMEGQRIMSRIYGMCIRIFVGGEDYRTRGVVL